MYKPLAHIPPASTHGHVCLSCRRYLHTARSRRSPEPSTENNGGGEYDLFPLNDISSDYPSQANTEVARESPQTGGRTAPRRVENGLQIHRHDGDSRLRHSGERRLDLDRQSTTSKDRRIKQSSRDDGGVKSLLSKLEMHTGITEDGQRQVLPSSKKTAFRSNNLARNSQAKHELLETMKSVKGTTSTQDSNGTATVPQAEAPKGDTIRTEDAKTSLTVEAQIGSVVERIIAARKAKAAEAAEAAKRTAGLARRTGPVTTQAQASKSKSALRKERQAANRAKGKTTKSLLPAKELAKVELTASEIIAAGDLLGASSAGDTVIAQEGDGIPTRIEIPRKPSPFTSRVARTDESGGLQDTRLYKPVFLPTQSDVRSHAASGHDEASQNEPTAAMNEIGPSERANERSVARGPDSGLRGAFSNPPHSPAVKSTGRTRTSMFFPPIIASAENAQSARKPTNLAEKARYTNEKVKWGGVETASRNANSFSASYDSLREADQVTPPAPPPVTASATKPWGIGGSSMSEAISANAKSAVSAISDAVSTTSGSAATSTRVSAPETSTTSTGARSGGFFSSLKAKFLGTSDAPNPRGEDQTANTEIETTVTTTPDVESTLPADAKSQDSLGFGSPAATASNDDTVDLPNGAMDRLAAPHQRSKGDVSSTADTGSQGQGAVIRRIVTQADKDILHWSRGALRLRPLCSVEEAQERYRRSKSRAEIAQSGCLTGDEPATKDATEVTEPSTEIATESATFRDAREAVTSPGVPQQSSTENGKPLAEAMQGAGLTDTLEAQQSSGDDSNSSRPVPEDVDPDISELEGCDHGTVDASGLEVTALNIEQPAVPKLSFGLERVLFNPGVYQLQDPHSRVYNFDPYLQNIMPVDEFDFNALKEYKTSSKDNALSDLALAHGKKYIGSTSSMTSTLGHFHYLLSNWRDLNLDMLSVNFPAPSRTFTQINRAPTAVFLKWKNGTYAIDADKEFDSGNVLMMLGKSMEKLLTLPKSEYERYRKSDPREIPVEERDAPEAFQYTTMGDFLMRSQLDAYDPRLPGTGMFDLKTRAVLPIRMDAGDYKPMLGYELTSLQGEFRSYEREYSDMLRSTMLKYMLQARMGRMDGIFLAYHNVQRIFGFQYLPIKEIDRAIHGQIHPCLGDQEFKLSLDMLNKVLEMATAKFPEKSLRLHFETKPDKDRDLTALYVFAEPMEDDEIDKIQNKTKEKLANFEKEMMGFVKEEKPDTSTPAPSSSKPPAMPEIPTDLSSSPLFAATLITIQKVNGAQVPRPKRLVPTDEWSVEYLIKPMSDPTQAWASYAACKDRRRQAFQKDDEKEGEEVGEEKVVNAYFQRLRDMAKEGREWREKIDGLEVGRKKVVLGMEVEEVAQDEEAPVKDTDSYLKWLYAEVKA